MIKQMSSEAATKCGVNVKGDVKERGISTDHNSGARGLRIKSRVKSGFSFVAVISKSSPNHNQTAALRVA